MHARSPEGPTGGENHPGFGLICISLGKIDKKFKNWVLFHSRLSLHSRNLAARNYVVPPRTDGGLGIFFKTNFVGVWGATVSDFADVPKIWGTERCGAFFDVKDLGRGRFPIRAEIFLTSTLFETFVAQWFNQYLWKRGGQKKEEEEEEKRKKSYLPTFSLYVTLVVEREGFFPSPKPHFYAWGALLLSPHLRPFNQSVNKHFPLHRVSFEFEKVLLKKQTPTFFQKFAK